MSTEADKFNHSKRLHDDENAINRQLKIAKQHITGAYNTPLIKEPHRMVKHHAMDCGNPRCSLCGNPRRDGKNRLTAQEKRLFQDLDSVNTKHSNGNHDTDHDL